jgi:HK97 gp10 family phage protein
MKLEGAQDLARALDDLGSSAARKAVRPAVNAGLTPINKAAKRNTPKESGALRASLGKVVKLYKRTGTIWGGVGARKSPKFWREFDGVVRKPAFYSHLVERGTIDQTAQPYLRPALDAWAAQSLGILRTKTIAGIERETKRLAAKAKARR